MTGLKSPTPEGDYSKAASCEGSQVMQQRCSCWQQGTLRRQPCETHPETERQKAVRRLLSAIDAYLLSPGVTNEANVIEAWNYLRDLTL